MESAIIAGRRDRRRTAVTATMVDRPAQGRMLQSPAVPSDRHMLQNLLYVGAALLLVLLNGFFVASEFALV
jgi:hypothetical protein